QKCCFPSGTPRSPPERIRAQSIEPFPRTLSPSTNPGGGNRVEFSRVTLADHAPSAARDSTCVARPSRRRADDTCTAFARVHQTPTPESPPVHSSRCVRRATPEEFARRRCARAAPHHLSCCHSPPCIEIPST